MWSVLCQSDESNMSREWHSSELDSESTQSLHNCLASGTMTIVFWRQSILFHVLFKSNWLPCAVKFFCFFLLLHTKMFIVFHFLVVANLLMWERSLHLALLLDNAFHHVSIVIGILLSALPARGEFTCNRNTQQFALASAGMVHLWGHANLPNHHQTGWTHCHCQHQLCVGVLAAVHQQ